LATIRDSPPAHEAHRRPVQILIGNPLNTIAADLPGGADTTARAWQPKGLAVIFATEAWERFSYYGMRALLVLYLVNALGYKREDALVLYGTYTGLVYVTPLIGGWIADKWLGMRLAAVIGGTVMMLGHFAMAVPSLLHVALGLLIVGNGFFKPNTSSMVGELYDGVDDPRRDGGYTIFYMGINLGAFFSPLVCGTLGQNVGWHWGFASAGVGMAIGLFTLLTFQRVIGRAGLRDDQASIGWNHLPAIAIWTLACVGVVYAGLAVGPLWSGLPVAAKVILALAVIAAATQLPKLVGGGTEAAKPLTAAEWKRVIAICIVVFFSIAFWMGFEQAGGSMNLFADKQTDCSIFGYKFPSSWFQSVNPLLIFLLAPVFTLIWTAINRSRFSLPDTAKQGLGIVVLGLGFVIMYLAQVKADATGPVGPLWLFGAYALHTVGELMLSPVGLALTSRSAPAQIAALLMGVWMLSSAAGNYLAGTLESIMSGTGIQPYLFLTVFSIAMGIVLLLLTPVLHRMLRARDISTTA
jgi:POT family proton-dependent oligopeptide transporter